MKNSRKGEVIYSYIGKKRRTGEITTLIMLGTLIVIGISTLVSSVFLSNQTIKQLTKSKAMDVLPDDVTDKRYPCLQCDSTYMCSSTGINNCDKSLNRCNNEGGRCGIESQQLEPCQRCKDNRCITYESVLGNECNQNTSGCTRNYYGDNYYIDSCNVEDKPNPPQQINEGNCKGMDIWRCTDGKFYLQTCDFAALRSGFSSYNSYEEACSAVGNDSIPTIPPDQHYGCRDNTNESIHGIKEAWCTYDPMEREASAYCKNNNYIVYDTCDFGCNEKTGSCNSDPSLYIPDGARVCRGQNLIYFDEQGEFVRIDCGSADKCVANGNMAFCLDQLKEPNPTLEPSPNPESVIKPDKIKPSPTLIPVINQINWPDIKLPEIKLPDVKPNFCEFPLRLLIGPFGFFCGNLTTPKVFVCDRAKQEDVKTFDDKGYSIDTIDICICCDIINNKSCISLEGNCKK